MADAVLAAVIDASAVVDLLLDSDLGRAVGNRITDRSLHAPAHVDAEVLSALGRLQRAGEVDETDVELALTQFVATPLTRYPVADLLFGAWARRHRVRLADALYLELANSRGLRLVTTDRRLRNEPNVEVVRV